MQYHGGDIYRNQIRLDFSVNTNPLGMPDSVREALIHQAVEEAEHYPDIHAQELANAVAEQLRISEKKLVFGNGASELFHAVLHAVKPSEIYKYRVVLQDMKRRQRRWTVKLFFMR